MTRLVLGVDPGARYLGMAKVSFPGAQLVGALVIDRDRRGIDATDRRGWCSYVLGELEHLAADVDLVALEDVRAPSPHVRRRDGNSLTNLDGLVGTAVLVGAILGRYPDLELIAPNRHGLDLDAAYPPLIRRGTRLGGPSDHARAAYDVALAARWPTTTT